MSDDKAALMDKKKELQERLENIRKDLRHELSADLEEQVTEIQNRDVLMEIARVIEEELAAINSKLNGKNE